MRNRASFPAYRWIPFGVTLLLSSCVGGIGDPVADENSGPKTAPATDATVLRHLNNVELANTLEVLLGDAYKGDPDAVSQRMSNDPLVQGFDTIAEAITTSSGYVEQAHGLIEYIVGQTDVVALSECDAAAKGEASCVDTFLDNVGLHALRRPLTTDERASYKVLFDKVQQADSYEGALAALLTRLLQSPDFLYHVALGDSETGKLVDHELASRLSYLLWENMPDDELFDAAASGNLRTPDDVEKQATRMLSDPRASRTLTRFFELWVGARALTTIVKDPAVYPEFEALRPSMMAELDMFLQAAVAGDGDVTSLLTSPAAFVDAPLAELYGVSPPSGDGFVQVKVDPKQRAGLLTQAAFLAIYGKSNRSAPILRGVFVREKLLCAPLPPPPPNAGVIPAGVPSQATTRDFFVDLTKAESCMVCHSQINPIGFGFEAFDGIGRHRTEENGVPVDASGEITAGDKRGAFDGAVDLANKLASSTEVARCLTTQWLRFRFGRGLGPHDSRIIDQAEDALAKEGGKLRALPAILARSEAFYDPHYQLEAEEVSP